MEHICGECIAMPRKARIDAASSLHHIIARGIERRRTGKRWTTMKTCVSFAVLIAPRLDIYGPKALGTPNNAVLVTAARCGLD